MARAHRETEWQRQTRLMENRIIALFPKLCYNDLEELLRLARKKARELRNHSKMLQEVAAVKKRWAKRSRKAAA